MLFGQKMSGLLADEITTPGPGQVRALFVDGGNPAAAMPGQGRFVDALRSLDLLVTIDPFMTATARLSHFVIPPTMMFEHADLGTRDYESFVLHVPYAQYASKVAGVAGFTVQQETVDDALAAVALLRSLPGIDPRRVFVLGHSLGGLALPRIGQGQPALAGLIVMAGPARPLEDLILDQVSYLAALDGVVTDPEKKQIEGLRGEVAKVKALKPGATDSVLGAPASYWLDLQGYDPPQAAKYLAQPMLILQGERDYQVTMTDFAAWKKVLSGKPNVTFKSYPRLDHLFLAGEGKSGPAEYQKPGHVEEAVVADVAAWVLGLGKKPAERSW